MKILIIVTLWQFRAGEGRGIICTDRRGGDTGSGIWNIGGKHVEYVRLGVKMWNMVF